MVCGKGVDSANDEVSCRHHFHQFEMREPLSPVEAFFVTLVQ